MSIRMYGLVAMLCIWLPISILAAQATQPLEPGDKVPDKLWTYLRHQLVNKEIELAATGKWTILQLMQTTCGSCVKAMPQLQQLQQAHADSLQVLVVSPQSIELMKAFAAKQAAKGIRLPMVAQDTLCQALFPHFILSHVVWISPEGRVRALTSSDSFSEEAWQQALNGKITGWRVKRDVFAFDKAEPLLKANAAHADVLAGKSVLHTAFAACLPGVAPSFGSMADSARGLMRFWFINFSAASMYKMLLGTFLNFPQKRVIWQLPDRASYEMPANETRKEAWKMKNARCFEAVYPLAWPVEKRRAFMLGALNLYFGIRVRMEDRDTAVLQLQLLDSTMPMRPKPACQVGDPAQWLYGTQLDWLTDFLNSSVPNLPIVMSSLPPGQALAWCFPRKATESISQLNLELAAYNLCLRPAHMPVNFMLYGQSDPSESH